MWGSPSLVWRPNIGAKARAHKLSGDSRRTSARKSYSAYPLAKGDLRNVQARRTKIRYVGPPETETHQHPTPDAAWCGSGMMRHAVTSLDAGTLNTEPTCSCASYTPNLAVILPDEPTTMVNLTPAARAKIDAYLDAYVTPGHPGTMVGLTNKAGEVLYYRSVGGDVSGQAYEEDTVWWIASCSKLLTSIAAMQLVEAGKIGLDDPLGDDVVPALKAPDMIVNSSETSYELAKPK